jgi:phosphoribosylformylglycinamidine cyclo-ligase
LAGFVVGVVERKKILRSRAVRPGDILIGLPSSGLHSNGYSLARKVLFEMGRMKVRQRVAELGRTVGEELLEPTRIYAGALPALFRRGAIKGAAHITGGGIAGNLPRILPPGRRAFIRRGSWPVPPIFDLIQRTGQIALDEMARTFNNGLGMILVVARENVDRVSRVLAKKDEKHFLIGEIKKGARGVSFIK